MFLVSLAIFFVFLINIVSYFPWCVILLRLLVYIAAVLFLNEVKLVVKFLKAFYAIVNQNLEKP